MTLAFLQERLVRRALVNVALVAMAFALRAARVA
jgi:hypothetical protein